MKPWMPSEFYRSKDYSGPLTEAVSMDTYEPCPAATMWYIPATNPMPEHGVGQKGRIPGELRHGDKQIYAGNGKYKVIPYDERKHPEVDR